MASNRRVGCPVISKETDQLFLCLSQKKGIATVQALLEAGADVNGMDLRFSTPLFYAFRSESEEVVKLLIDWGADVNSPDDNGWTPLHHASVRGWKDLVQILLKRNVDINAKASTGDTPLLMACINAKFDTGKLLFEAGADSNTENNAGLSLIRILVFYSKVDLIRLCIANGACFKFGDYEKMLTDPELKENVLRDEELCSQAIINEFNTNDLADLYRIPMCADAIPSFEQMKIESSSKVARDIKQAVALEIESRGHCNLWLMVHPIALKLLSVKSFLGYYRHVVNQ